jgi:hypothetical protein
LIERSFNIDAINALWQCLGRNAAPNAEGSHEGPDSQEEEFAEQFSLALSRRAASETPTGFVVLRRNQTSAPAKEAGRDGFMSGGSGNR